MTVYEALKNSNDIICRNIEKFEVDDRGILSENILSQLRNFLEAVMGFVYLKGKSDTEYNYDLICASIDYIIITGEYSTLRKFHDLLQISSSHYTLSEDSSERLMLKYYEYLLKVKIMFKEKFKMEVLENISNFPLNVDKQLSDFYEKILEKIENPSSDISDCNFKDRYYIKKIKPIFIKEKIFYEITLTLAYSNVSKFERVIVFSKSEILDNYAVKLSVHKDSIKVLNRTMDIRIIDSWEVSIRPCEIDAFASIFLGGNVKIYKGERSDYENLMKFITKNLMPLSRFVELPEDLYQKYKDLISKNVKKIQFLPFLDKSRNIILNNLSGKNVLKYILYRMNHRIIKSQLSYEKCNLLSNLYLNIGCNPFDTMPLCTSLINHNPVISDLLDIIGVEDREEEFIARYIRCNTEIERLLFTPSKSILELNANAAKLIEQYNDNLYYKHTGRQIKQAYNYFYLNEYVEDCKFIIQKLNDYAKEGIKNYRKSVKSWLDNNPNLIDCDEKIEVISNIFDSSRVGVIYGAAGTGKSTLINYISLFWSNSKKLFLTNTHPALDNLRRKITVKNCTFKTIAKMLYDKETSSQQTDLLIIDECSTVSNSDMKKILKSIDFKFLVLVGDIYQIESIIFGNWFELVKYFLPKTAIAELNKPFRTKNPNLLNVWNKVREVDYAMLEPIVKNGYSSKLDESIFENRDDDEIILCLNYDGLYGINNINNFLQNSNHNNGVQVGINIYKEGDPVLFDESKRFPPMVHNNTKGIIKRIDMMEDRVAFEIELDFVLNEFDIDGYALELKDSSREDKSIIRFDVLNESNTDEEKNYEMAIVPFQVAYAISIHKSQGLEYNSVKIILTDEVSENISHNIFYTAITRAKEKLRIYWSPETEKKVLENFKINNSKKDAYILKSLLQK